MPVDIVELHDASEALDRARAFLVAEPAHHNLLLTILDTSIEFSLAGRFWVVSDGTDVAGFGLESPPGMGAVLAPMPAAIARQLAEIVSIPLPRVMGEAGTAAAFAGVWTQRHRVGGEPEGGRFYELGTVCAVADAPGRLRLAERADRPWSSGRSRSAARPRRPPRTPRKLWTSRSRASSSGSGTTAGRSR